MTAPRCGACSAGRHVDCSGWCFCGCGYGRALVVLVALACSACGGQIGDSSQDVGDVTAAGVLPAPKDPQCERVLTYAAGLAASGCGLSFAGEGVDLTDEASCVGAGDALDACYADGACRIDVGARLLGGCKALVPYWPCIGAPSYDACVKAP